MLQPELETLIGELQALEAEMVNLVEQNGGTLEDVHPANRPSAVNLLHYVALRRHDIRALQERLAVLGLSSLGRSEPHVLSGLRSVIAMLQDCCRQEDPAAGTREGNHMDRVEGQRTLVRNTELLLGSAPQGRGVRIMVTMPSEAASDYQLVRDLVMSGMNCMRINCAHDNEEAWASMIANLRRAEEETGKTCKIEMDVGGPKLRTGPIAPGPAVLKYRPKRDDFGRVMSPARVCLTPIDEPAPRPSAADASIPVPGAWLETLRVGDRVRFKDARDARRSLEITEVAGNSRWAESRQTTYITPGLPLTAVYRNRPQRARRGYVGAIPAKPQVILLQPGDTLILTRSLEPGRPAQFDEHKKLISPARIGVTLAEVFESAVAGQPIWLDDGKFGGVITDVAPDRLTVEIHRTKAGGDKLGAEKGINLPETNLRIASLTSDDLEALKFIAKNADLIGYSFVRTEKDVRLLQARLAELGSEDLGIILKIETRGGFDNLPSLLLAALRSRNVGVMIARGDLAIECGFERMAEAQEEILWISEAAHVPVVWATQVLESLAKTGTPSRSEITDAAMGERAECVMLNKGPYVVEAVRTLDDILQRMQDHQEKKRSMLRRLGVAAGFAGGTASERSGGSAVRFVSAGELPN